MISSGIPTLPDGAYLEVAGFLSFGIFHDYANALTRIQLLAESGALETGNQGRERHELIVNEIDAALDKSFLRTWFSGLPFPGETVVLDADALHTLCGIMRYSCRRFLFDCSFSIDPGVRLSGPAGYLGVLLVFPPARVCPPAGTFSPEGSYSLDIRLTSKGDVEVEHTFSPRSDRMEALKPFLRRLNDEAVQWSISSESGGDTLLMSIPGGERDFPCHNRCDIGE